MNVGVLGAGQLGRMLALAGYPLGLRFRFLDPTPDSPASHLAEQIVSAYDDLHVLEQFATGLDVVTYEFENVPVEAVQHLYSRLPVYPPPEALEAVQDRLTEKELFRRLGVPTAPFVAVRSLEDLEVAVSKVGLPAVVKTRRLGYDGKGQWIVRQGADIQPTWEAADGAALIVEGFVAFERELSILAVRSRAGETAFYPLVENHHRDGILRRSCVDAATVGSALQRGAEGYAAGVLDALGYVGVLAIEFFEVRGSLVANEMAPRVHNSGHWTIEGAETSQFENHLRAVVGLPLGNTDTRGASAMINLIGALPDTAAVLQVPGAHLHLYGKTPRAGRKLGHVTATAADEDELDDRLKRLDSLLGKTLDAG